MAREIKFRGKRIDNGEWVYGFYEYFLCGEETTPRHFINPFEIPPSEIDEAESIVEVIPETVGQFTGIITDEGLTPIFTWDVVLHNNLKFLIFDSENFGIAGWGLTNRLKEHLNGNLPTKILIGISTYEEFHFFYRTRKYSKVIGNIFDHPNLLK